MSLQIFAASFYSDWGEGQRANLFFPSEMSKNFDYNYGFRYGSGMDPITICLIDRDFFSYFSTQTENI